MEAGDGSIESIEFDSWNRLLAVNLTGVMLTVQSAVKAMRKNPGGPTGSIIINSSMNAYRPMGNFIAYSTTKMALIAVSKSAVLHCASQGLKIRCNTIHPGVVETDMIRGVINRAPDPRQFHSSRIRQNAVAGNRHAQMGGAGFRRERAGSDRRPGGRHRAGRQHRKHQHRAVAQGAGCECGIAVDRLADDARTAQSQRQDARRRRFHKCAAIEVAALGDNIRVNSVHPGGIDTVMLNSTMQRYVDLGAVKSTDAANAGHRCQSPDWSPGPSGGVGRRPAS